MPDTKTASAVLLAIGIVATAPFHALAAQGQPQDRRQIEVDFGQSIGRIRPLHGVNCGPIAEDFTLDLSSFFRELAIPHVRLHAPNAPGQDCVHVQHIFPDMSADVEDPDSYDFEKTDAYIAAVIAVGAKPLYNLGLGNENRDVRGPKYRRSGIPPADFDKWARICVNIARHYNDGWANGFHYGIAYWEIWNEPNAAQFWKGTFNQFMDFYATVATALKRHDPTLKVGGPAVVGEGFARWLENFLAVCQRRALPLDFCSWHCYHKDALTALNRSRQVQGLLDKYGFTEAENHLTEWSPTPLIFAEMRKDPLVAREFFNRTGSAEGGAFDVSVLCYLQDSPVDVAAFYSGDTLRWGFIDRNGAPKTSYFAFKAFRRMLDTPSRVVTQGNDLPQGFAVLAGLAPDKSRAQILISNHCANYKSYAIRVRGLPWREDTVVTRSVVDRTHELASVATDKFSAGDAFVIAMRAVVPSVFLLELAPPAK